jgi:hypothetical protein
MADWFARRAEIHWAFSADAGLPDALGVEPAKLVYVDARAEVHWNFEF